jgi:hypothetical protein
MTTCRTVEQARAAGRAAGEQTPPLTQDQADYIAALLAPYLTAERRAA